MIHKAEDKVQQQLVGSTYPITSATSECDELFLAELFT
jgi:hypothetical protein